MKSRKWKLGTLAAMALAATTFVSQAQASVINLTFTPVTGITTAGGAVGVDIVASGLPSAMGGFSLDLDYGNLIFGSYTLGPGGTMGPIPFDLSLGDLGGTVSFAAFIDLALTPEAAAFAAQNSGGLFTMAHVDFTGQAAGPFTLDLRNVALSDFDGTALLVCTGAACAASVPEPTTMLLLGTGLGALVLRRRKQSKSQL